MEITPNSLYSGCQGDAFHSVLLIMGDMQRMCQSVCGGLIFFKRKNKLTFTKMKIFAEIIVPDLKTRCPKFIWSWPFMRYSVKQKS